MAEISDYQGYASLHKGAEIDEAITIILSGLFSESITAAQEIQASSELLAQLAAELPEKVDGGYTADGYLYLTAGGEVVVGPLGPFSGSGGTLSFSVESITDDSGNTGHRVSISDGTTVSAFDVMDGAAGTDGVSPTIQVTETEDGHCVTITDANGETSFEVLDGKDGTDLSYDFDAEPTEGSGNLVTSGGIYSYVQAAIFEAMEASY